MIIVCSLDESNQDLKELLQRAVRLGQEEHRSKLAEAAKASVQNE